jgi:serine/threonine-protein kinase
MIELAVGERIAGRYLLERPLGEGGMAVVWAATHVLTRARVALKILKTASREARGRFLREARIAATLHHPAIAEVRDAFELEDGTPVMVIELLDGVSLDAVLAREPTLSVARTVSVATAIASALGAAHAQGIVHRDLKPQNVFLLERDRLEAGYGVKVLDFGIAKLTMRDDEGAPVAPTETGEIIGTPHYMAPEQVFGERDVDHRADVWALGVLIFEALAGRRPFHGDNYGQIFKQITTGRAPSLATVAPHVPPALVDLVARMLAHDRERRPHDMHDVIEALAPLLEEGAPIVPDFDRPRHPSSRRERIATAPTTGSVPPPATANTPPAPLARPRPRSRPRQVATGAAVLALFLGVVGVASRARSADAARAAAAAAAPLVASSAPSVASAPPPIALPTTAPTTAPHHTMRTEPPVIIDLPKPGPRAVASAVTVVRPKAQAVAQATSQSATANPRLPGGVHGVSPY